MARVWLVEGGKEGEWVGRGRGQEGPGTRALWTFSSMGCPPALCRGSAPAVSRASPQSGKGLMYALPAGRRLSRSHRSDTSPGVYAGL